jgi:murein L,D-transpeptidase YafK
MKRIIAAIPFVFIANVTCANVDLIMVDKSTRTMYLMESGAVIRKYKVALGGQPRGHKSQEGDERTPEGIYTLDFKKEDSAFHRSMHINYPNAKDVENAQGKGVKPGGAIMIHGQKNGLEKLAFISKHVDWTDGCIALTNAEMDEFMTLVDVGTKIRIEWKLEKTPTQKQ